RLDSMCQLVMHASDGGVDGVVLASIDRLERIEVALRGYVGPSDRGKVLHQDRGLLGPQNRLQPLIQLMPGAFIHSHCSSVRPMSTRGGDAEPTANRRHPPSPGR